MERAALQEMIKEIERGNIDTVIVYKLDRLSRSILDFHNMMKIFEKHNCNFVSITQAFDTSNSMGKLTLNMLLSFAQFEREISSERVKDKIANSKKKGLWMGGTIPLGYDIKDKQLMVNQDEAKTVQLIFETYIKVRCVRKIKATLHQQGVRSKQGKAFSRGALYTILKNPIYIGKVQHRGKHFDGAHEPAINEAQWQEVQTILHQNRHAKTHRVQAKQPSLLAGLLLDDQGHVMSPTHTSKQQRRYRYYVSQALLHYRTREAGSVLRVPAHDIEQPVIHALLDLLRTPDQLQSLFNDQLTNALQQKALLDKTKVMANDWPSMPTSKQIEWLKLIVKQIIVGQQRLILRINCKGLATVLRINTTKKQIHEITIPIQLKRCGLEMKVVIPNQIESNIDQSTLSAIQTGIIQALAWNKQLLNGDVSSIQEIATREKLDRSYVMRRLRLAYLAPDIITTILTGHIPPDLTINKLREGFPFDWKAQRKQLGFNEILPSNVTRKLSI
jgi:DNA invertase Pin-like site-specific DNA recombinase